MKRLLIVLVAVVVLALTVALPAAGKGKPDKPPKEPEPEPVLVCDFVDGVLWITEEDEPTTTWQWIGDGHVRCKLTAEPSDSFTFVMESTSTGAHTALHPYLAVTDVYPHSGNRCYVHNETGKQVADGTGVFTTFTIDRLDSYGGPDGICGGDRPDTDGPGVYALTVSVQKTWGGDGTVQLKME